MDQSQYAAMLPYLQAVPDPRKKRGQRYPWWVLLGIICAALLSGQFSARAIAQWAELHAEEVVSCLQQIIVRVPSASTILRALRRVDIESLEEQIGWLGQRLDAEDAVEGEVVGPRGEVLRGQAVDGKEVRGASAHGDAVVLVSLVRHGSGVTLAQQQVEEHRGEIPAVQQLLKGRDLRGTVTTCDAQNTQRGLAQEIMDQQGDYVMEVKKNQATLYADLETFFQNPQVMREEADWDSYTSYGKGHGRFERRTVLCSERLNAYLTWPGVQQVLQRTCQRTPCKGGPTRTEVHYWVASLARERAGAYQLEQFCRGHWTIEDRDHYVRDETLREDRCQIHTGPAPEALAALKNGLLALLRYQGWSNIADALRYFGASVARAFAFLAGNTS